MKIRTSIAIVTSALLIMTGWTQAGTTPLGTAFTYQGELIDGGELANGTYDLLFSLWDNPGKGNPPSGGSQIGNFDCANDIAVVNGVFTVDLDFGEGIFGVGARWLEIAVRFDQPPASCDSGNYTTLAPRQRIAPAPLALALPGLRTQQNTFSPNILGGFDGNSIAAGIIGATIGGGGDTGAANQADANFATVSGGSSNIASGMWSTVPGGNLNTALAEYSFAAGRRAKANHVGAFVWADSTNANFTSTAANQFLIRATGGVGIGTTSPTDYVQIDAPVDTDALRVRVAGATKFRVHSNGGLSIGGNFESTVPADGMRISGHVGIGVQPNCPLDAEANSTGGFVICGYNTAATGASYGVFGRSDSNNGRGVYGEADSPTGVAVGVGGTSLSTQGVGVLGIALATSGFNTGVAGESDSPDGRGVSGHADSATGGCIGVRGSCDSGNGYSFYAIGAGTFYGSGSSIRWKRNIEPIADPLEIVAQLRGVYFDWDDEHGGRYDIGMIAEEVGAVLPEIVNYEANGIDASGMDYSRLTPLLVEAVKALRAEKDAEIESLRTEVAELKALVYQLASSRNGGASQ